MPLHPKYDDSERHGPYGSDEPLIIRITPPPRKKEPLMPSNLLIAALFVIAMYTTYEIVKSYAQ
jgi:hypothetical protein